MKKNSYLGVDLKTQLQSDGLMTPGKDYRGVLRRDVTNDEYVFNDEHFTFVETIPPVRSSNPKVYQGRHISVTRQPDGSPRVNVRQINMSKNFSVAKYAREVHDEIKAGLNAFIEEAD